MSASLRFNSGPAPTQLIYGFKSAFWQFVATQHVDRVKLDTAIVMDSALVLLTCQVPPDGYPPFLTYSHGSHLHKFS